MPRLITRLRDFSFLLGLLLLSQQAFAQGNLKFSQVKYLTFSYNAALPNTTTVLDAQSLVVAPGHVLKVENVAGLNALFGNSTSPNTMLALTIDDVIYSRSSITTTYVLQTQTFPVWLPAGTYSVQLKYFAPSSATNLTVKAALSGLDFELVP